MKGADLIKVDKNRMGEGSPRGLASKDLGADEEQPSNNLLISKLTSATHSKEISRGGAPDKQNEESHDLDAQVNHFTNDYKPPSVPRTAEHDDGAQNRRQDGAASPSRTDTAFYEGKASHTESKPKVPPQMAQPQIEKQLSEAPGELLSPKGRIDDDENDKGPLNYQTEAENAGDGYFPQILKYTENAPQESILSRDNYSTSQHPSMISQPHQKAAAPAKGAPNRVRKYYNKNKKPGADSVLSGEVTSPTGIIDPKKKESMEQPKLKNIITQNVARLEKQNPSTKASILSHSLQEDDDRADINARASGLENVTEEEGYHEKSLTSPAHTQWAAKQKSTRSKF